MTRSDDACLLTICAVSYRSASLLDLNLSLTRKLNTTGSYRWLIVDNNNDFPTGSLTGEEDVQLLQGEPCVNEGALRGSYHHAQALNKALQHVSTRYLLVIDPDFFIFHRDWINEVLNHMSENGLSFWGAPYYPDLTWKRRYFPTVSCMLIDLEKTGKELLDFTPELDEYLQVYGYPTWALLGILVGIIPDEVRSLTQPVLTDIAQVVLRIRWIAEPLSHTFPKRFYSNTNVSRDTGFKIQNSFGRNPKYQVETLVAAYVNDLYTRKDSLLKNLAAWLYALLIPESLSIYPKRRDYCTLSQFRNFNLIDVRGQFGWEEFFWKGKPFAIHMKGGTSKYIETGHERFRGILSRLSGERV
ncbi:MAG: glycosyltransferase [Anaerolineales bacterium]|nr:glycosyltransferase [Anaerolineales bacterium]